MLCLLASCSLSAQIITTDPAFPTDSDEVTLYFDASQGNAGLKDCNCDIYLHTGVITSESNNDTDWKYVRTVWGQANDAWKLSPVAGSPNLYSFVIGPSVREYYQVPAGEGIEKMAFVFRNGTGSLEGKNTGGADIFAQVYDESLQINLASPVQEVLSVDPGFDILVQAQTNRAAHISLYRDGVLLSEVMDAAELTYTIDADTQPHAVEIRAQAGDEMVSKSFVYLVPYLLSTTPAPAAYADGLTELNETTAVFQLNAPSNQFAFLLGDFNNWQPSRDNLMHRTADGTFWLQVDGLTPGATYTYQYLVDEGIRVADPLSTLVLDPSNDAFIPEVTFPDLPDYPAGKGRGIVSVFTMNAPDFSWQVIDFQAPPREELVIYELLLRDFVERHDYQTLQDSLDYLQRLGVNAIELMPVSEFEGNISWGYNPSFHMALDKYYGTPEAFKSFIDECHQRGIAVILDVVYNHAFSQSPLAQLDWNDTAFKPTATNPWLNVDAKHPFNVGYDFNHDSPHTRRFVDQVIKYWLEEYRIDGFRFDLSKGFTQRSTSDVGFWGSYDANRISILKHYADVMWSVNPDAYVILEHFADNSEETELINYGMMSWAGGGLHNQYLEAALGFASDLTGAAYTSRNWSNPHLVGYIESHDEERLVYKNTQFGNSNGDYDISEYPTAIKRSELAAAFFYTIPGPKMLWQFGELGYDYSINTCEDGTVNDNCRLSLKPIRWDYQDDPYRKRLFEVVSGLIHLKTNYDVFNTADFTLDVGSGTPVKKIFLNGEEMDVVVQGNFDVSTRELSMAFSQTGWWYDYFTGDSILVEEPNMSVTLAPGAYHVYTSVRLGTPPNGFPTGTTELVQDYFKLRLSPNPTNGPLRLTYQLPRAGTLQIGLSNSQGQLIRELYQGYEGSGIQEKHFELDLPAGIYYLHLLTAGKKEVRGFVID